MTRPSAAGEPTVRALLDVATEAAHAGGRRTLAYFQNAVGVEWKADGSPVTIADREAETTIRRVIAGAFPDHAVLGEEHGATDSTSPYRWIIDPIDGTKTFIRGVPLYGTLVAVEHHGEPIVGVIYMPALDELVAAGRGEGCTWNGRPARVSAVDRLEHALVTGTDLDAIGRAARDWPGLVSASLLQRTWADCYGYVLVATGRAEVALDFGVSVWDLAAPRVVIEEAGGAFTSWQGERTASSPSGVATNGRVHEAVRSFLV